MATNGKVNNSNGTVTDQVKRNEREELEIAHKMGAPDVYIDAEADTDWYLWKGTIYCKPLRFENRTGLYVIVLKTDPRAELGKHRHRGEVRAYTVKGNWGYHEYDWTGKPGDYITEMPGTIHTLWMGEDSEVMFNVVGSIEFFNDDDTLRETMDGFSFWRMYVEHCREKGVRPNEKLWY
ncbi:RmlC-like cupin domain-containing protein [Xylariomycetidae sp. FL2044]|nr:RmlC-like cupin domain-containing protein [Xylariomycetidae sp. FL2044]